MSLNLYLNCHYYAKDLAKQVNLTEPWDKIRFRKISSFNQIKNTKFPLQMSAFLQLLPGDVDLVHLTLELQSGTHLMISSNRIDPACVITWLCTDSPLPDCYIVLLITSKHPTHSNTGTVTVAELSCTHSFPHNDPMHGFGDECVQYYSQPQSCTHV